MWSASEKHVPTTSMTTSGNHHWARASSPLQARAEVEQGVAARGRVEGAEPVLPRHQLRPHADVGAPQAPGASVAPRTHGVQLRLEVATRRRHERQRLGGLTIGAAHEVEPAPEREERQRLHLPRHVHAPQHRPRSLDEPVEWKRRSVALLGHDGHLGVGRLDIEVVVDLVAVAGHLAAPAARLPADAQVGIEAQLGMRIRQADLDPAPDAPVRALDPEVRLISRTNPLGKGQFRFVVECVGQDAGQQALFGFGRVAGHGDLQ